MMNVRYTYVWAVRIYLSIVPINCGHLLVIVATMFHQLVLGSEAKKHTKSGWIFSGA